jgi:hypothetical protein
MIFSEKDNIFPGELRHSSSSGRIHLDCLLPLRELEKKKAWHTGGRILLSGPEE